MEEDASPKKTENSNEDDIEEEQMLQMEAEFSKLADFLQKCKKILNPKANRRMYPANTEIEDAMTSLEYLMSTNEELASEVKVTHELLVFARGKRWRTVKNSVLAACVEIDAAECKYLKKDTVVSKLNKPDSVELANFDVWKECAALRFGNDPVSGDFLIHDSGADGEDFIHSDYINDFLPTQLAKQYCFIYDVEWSEAYNQITIHFEDDKDEEDIIKDISIITQLLFNYVKDKIKIHVDNMAAVMTKVVTEPIKQKQIKTPKSRCSNADDTAYKAAYKSVVQYARMAVRNTADISLPIFIKDFAENHIPKKLKTYLVLDKIQNFIIKCANFAWKMNSMETPMVLLWPTDIPADNLFYYFRYFTKFGTELEHGVWPALLLHQDGPVMVQGVAQLK